MSKKIVVRLADDQRQALRDRARECGCGMTASDLIRIAVARLLADPAVTLPRVERDRSQAAA